MAKSGHIYLGIDVGSVSVNTVVMNQNRDILEEHYTRTMGQPLKAVRKVLTEVLSCIEKGQIMTASLTGTAGKLVAELIGANFVNEIIAQSKSVEHLYPQVKTIVEIGGEDSVTVYAIIGRMLMFALFPVLGVTQGFLPIAGYNYGAGHWDRVRKSINTAILYASGLGLLVFAGIMVFSEDIVRVFTDNPTVARDTPNAMRWVFAATPIIALQLIGSAYFQAIGKAVPALLLTLSRQGFFFIPLVLILPNYFGEIGVWVSFPLADVLSTLVTAYFLNREIRLRLKPALSEKVT